MAFNVAFFILGRKEHSSKFEHKVGLEPYVNFKDNYKFRSYDEIIDYYGNALAYRTAKKGFI